MVCCMFRTKTSQPRAYHIADRQPASIPLPSGLGTLKTADRPLLILTLIPNDKHPRSQIRNSQRYLQTPVNQRLNTTRIFSALRLPSSTLRNMPFRDAIDGLSQHDRWSFATRSMVFRDAIHAKPQLETCLFAKRRGEKAVPIPPKRHCGFMVRAKSRHKFLTKKHDRRVFVTIRLSQRH